MARAADDGRCSRTTPRRKRASSTPAAGTGGPGRSPRCTAWGSPTPSWTGRSRSFSGGELTRASLARALAGDPDLLLLDEPTNHLDIASLEWLEGYLAELDAAVVLVAHDRWFLEAVGTSVLELEAGRARFFPGPWHAWRARGRRPRDRARQGDRQAAARDRPHGALRRALPLQGDQGAPGPVARQAARARCERIERDPRDTRSLGFSFGPAERTGRVVLELEDARLEVPGRTLLEDGELWLERGEHVSLVGPNGAGKTTLIEALAGRRAARRRPAPDRPQRQARLPLPARARSSAPTGTALDGRAARDRAHARARRAPCSAASCSPGEEAEKPLDGPLRRRAPAAVAGDAGGSDANVLILDEPTNHLDLDAREALEDALDGVRAARCCWSHTTARCSTRSAPARSRSRTAGCTATRAAGRSTRACARSGARQTKPAKRRGSQARAQRAERAHEWRRSRTPARIADREEIASLALAELEDELADRGGRSERSARPAARRGRGGHARWERATLGPEACPRWPGASRGTLRRARGGAACASRLDDRTWRKVALTQVAS